MSTENTIVEPAEVDLDTFSAELFGQSKTEAAPASAEVEETDEAKVDAPNEDEDTQLDEDHTLATEAEDDEDGDDEEEVDETKPAEEPKPKSRLQKRMDELNRRAREAEEREQALAQRLKDIETKLPKDEKVEPAPTKSGPTVDDLNEDGTDKYPLGDFDPNYIRDLTKHTLQVERDAIKVEEAREAQQKQYDAERAQLEKGWTEKLAPAKERYPDFQDKGEELFDTFSGIDASYGEYLTATIMSMDYGPDVLYYLANNLDEANKIVASGPTKATIALGRLESKFSDAEAEKQTARPRVSKAPAPPITQLKGASAAVVEVADDTDDLEAFSKKLFVKKK